MITAADLLDLSSRLMHLRLRALATGHTEVAEEILSAGQSVLKAMAALRRAKGLEVVT